MKDNTLEKRIEYLEDIVYKQQEEFNELLKLVELIVGGHYLFAKIGEYLLKQNNSVIDDLFTDAKDDLFYEC